MEVYAVNKGNIVDLFCEMSLIIKRALVKYALYMPIVHVALS